MRNSKGKKKARKFFLGTFPFHHISPVRLNYSYLPYGWLGRVKVNKIQHCNWLPEQARWRCVARSRLQRCSSRKMFLCCSLSHVINLLLTNLIRQKMAEYRPRIGRSKNKKKKIKVKTRPISSNLDRRIVVNNPYIFSSVEMCYEASKKAKKKYFAIQFFGECWVSDTESYKAHGPSTNCWNGVGRDYDNYVYEALW